MSLKSSVKMLIFAAGLILVTLTLLQLAKPDNLSKQVSLTTDNSIPSRIKYSSETAVPTDSAQPLVNTNVITPDSLNVLVDKQHGLPQTYEPSDLVALRGLGITTSTAGLLMRAEAAQALVAMLETMQTQGLKINLLSAYRSFREQLSTNTMWQNQLGSEEAAAVSAPPGYSEHQLGTTMDIGIPGNKTGFSGIYPDGKASPEWTWLDQNAHKYGFVMSYRNNQQNLTGYRFEPWHWRYVGIELATQVRLSGNPPQYSYSPMQ